MSPLIILSAFIVLASVIVYYWISLKAASVSRVLTYEEDALGRRRIVSHPIYPSKDLRLSDEKKLSEYVAAFIQPANTFGILSILTANEEQGVLLEKDEEGGLMLTCSFNPNKYPSARQKLVNAFQTVSGGAMSEERDIDVLGNESIIIETSTGADISSITSMMRIILKEGWELPEECTLKVSMLE